jgi:hypothetical protein
MDEDQERAEQAEMARREAQMLEMAAAAEADMAGNADGEQEEEEERDLDADVPEAEEEADDSDEEASGVDITFNEESLMEGSVDGDGDGREELEMEEAELMGRLQDERDLGLERDLDDSVPEAGSYQHTDTEVEDESSDEIDSDDEPMLRQSALRQPARNPIRTSGGNGRSSRILTNNNDQSDIMGSSSFAGSSPAMGRGPAQANAFRSRMMSSRRGRGG